MRQAHGSSSRTAQLAHCTRAKRLKGLEEEIDKLKRLLDDAMLDNVALKDLLSKNSDARRQARGRRPFQDDLRDERAADVPGHPRGPQDDPLGYGGRPMRGYRCGCVSLRPNNAVSARCLIPRFDGASLSSE